MLKGKCQISGITLYFKPDENQAKPSLDRLDNHKGYDVDGNIQLIHPYFQAQLSGALLPDAMKWTKTLFENWGAAIISGEMTYK